MSIDIAEPATARSTRPWDFPPGARFVIAFEFCERVGFYSMVALLALYLSADRASGGFGWSSAAALTFSGLYNGLMYALPVVGGWVADRFLGYRRALTVGGTLLFAGYVLLTIAVSWAHSGSGTAPLGLTPSPALPADAGHAYAGIFVSFWAAIVALIAGNALIKSTLVVALGDSFSGDDGRREGAYAYYYAGINLGGLVAGLIVGWVAAAYGWAPAFGFSAIAMGVAISTYVAWGRKHLTRRSSAMSRDASVDPNPRMSRRDVGVRLFVLGVFALLLLIYSIGSFQLWGAMSFFLEREVDRHVGSFEIPTQWFTSINAASLIVSAPAFAALWAWLARRNREPDIAVKYVWALALGALGILVFAYAAWPHSGTARPGWTLPAIGVWVQATGEVAAWTVTYGLVYRLAPRRIVAAVMGAYYATTLGLGAYLAGVLGTLAERWGEGLYFLVVGSATLAVAVMAVLIRPALRSLAESAGVELDSHTG
ncbi:MAG TPA: MFS transporter [Steroidobacteraceae bacterium]|nr:MFS transporter [Steroidobacteraceae bacterium]